MRQKNSPREDVAKRKSAPLERVKPLTLGGLAESGVRHIEAECEWCRHSALLDIAALIGREGADRQFRDIARRLKCSVCGWTRVEAWPVRPGREQERRRKSPLPSLSECRALLASVRVDSAAPAHLRHAAKMRAIRERWPELTASQALFVVQALAP